MWFLFINSFIYSLSFFYGFKFNDFLISSVLFLFLYFFYEKLKQDRAFNLGYSYKRDFNFKYLIFCALISVVSAGSLRFFYFGSFYLQSERSSLKLKDYSKIILWPILTLFLLALIFLVLNITFLYNILIVFILFNLLPIPGYDGSYLFASNIKRYRIYSILMLVVAVGSMLLKNNLFMIILSSLVILYVYFDYEKKDDSEIDEKSI